jgi:hypothetical protein
VVQGLLDQQEVQVPQGLAVVQVRLDLLAVVEHLVHLNMN